MGAGLKRNSPCWCGSGKKYKKCHLGREDAEPIKTWEAEKELRAAFSVKKCSAPADLHQECSGQIIKAHTVPRSSSLNAIAVKGHVYSFVPSVKGFEAANGKLEPILVGVRKASTFTGFCGAHDNAFFEKLEVGTFKMNAETSFLLGYRAVARELYTKESLVALNDHRTGLDKGLDELDQVLLQKASQTFNFAADQGLKDICAIKNKFDNILLSGDFSSVKAYVVELEELPALMCSGAWFVDDNIFGENIQDLSDLRKPPALITASAFGANGKGYVVFQWLEESDFFCHQLIKNFRELSDKDLLSSLVKLFFYKLENLHISPEWWEGLLDEDRATLIDLMASNADIFSFKPLNVLDTQISSPAWAISARTEI